MARRPHGELEHEVLAALWAAGEPLTAEDVRVAVSEDLAYTTVLTILVRLHEKGAVSRAQQGRAYAYAPLLDDADLTARRMRQILDGEADRSGVLSRFAGTLSAEDAAALRVALRKAKR